jgi:hypothetical protein
MFWRKCFKNQTVWPVIFGFAGPICAPAPTLKAAKELSLGGHPDWPLKPTIRQRQDRQVAKAKIPPRKILNMSISSLLVRHIDRAKKKRGVGG